MVNSLDFKKLVAFTQSVEAQRHFAQVVVRSRISDILHGYKTEHLSKDQAVKFLEELVEDQKEVARKKMIDDKLSESDGVE